MRVFYDLVLVDHKRHAGLSQLYLYSHTVFRIRPKLKVPEAQTSYGLALLRIEQRQWAFKRGAMVNKACDDYTILLTYLKYLRRKWTTLHNTESSLYKTEH